MTDDTVKLSHGAGGATEETLIQQLFLKVFEKRQAADGIALDALDDGASIRVGDREVILCIDGHTVDPVFFPGGDLGRLAVCGAVNDTAVMGADPIAVLDAIIAEEGLLMKDLQTIVESMNAAAKEAGVAIIAGDFKVMPHGTLDRIVISTAGVGILRGPRILDSQAQPGDKVILTGTVGDHGIALMSRREGLSFETELVSDVAPIHETTRAATDAGEVHAMKDLTRGGLAMALNDVAYKSNASIWLDASRIPVKPSVRAASEMLGLDPLEVTCEGKAIIVVKGDDADRVLAAVKATKYGRDAEIIGEVRGDRPGMVLLRTLVGGTRVLRKPLGEPIPRVC
ncbi:hydrogenase expression/formation protein HypE [Candidatus Bathyarchaeota archaeon RBG_13_60_20]|nr:MAG: hydrogenase expression/formation protein HypE [Candidatus Bathyarchaeota archaeon RBG_13_60_20]